MGNVAFLPGAFVFANYLLGRVGTYASVSQTQSRQLFVGVLLVILCLWLRSCINYSLAFLFVSNLVGGLAQPILLNLPPKVSHNWFAVRERPLATMMGGLATPVGQALGYVLSPFILPTEVTAQQPQEFKRVFRDLFFVCAIAGTAVLVVCIVIFREKPPRPPS